MIIILIQIDDFYFIFLALGGKGLAELSGKIFLMDRLLAIEGVILEKYSSLAIKDIIDDILNDFYRVEVTLKIESSHLRYVTYSCPYCNTENVLLEKEEKELKKKYSDFIKLFSKYEYYDDNKNRNRNKNKNENEYDCMIINYHNAYEDENKITNSSYDKEDLERRLLCYCSSCQLPSSAINFFENGIFI